MLLDVLLHGLALLSGLTFWLLIVTSGHGLVPWAVIFGGAYALAVHFGSPAAFLLTFYYANVLMGGLVALTLGDELLQALKGDYGELRDDWFKVLLIVVWLIALILLWERRYELHTLMPW